jgi:hypothetical protein
MLGAITRTLDRRLSPIERVDQIEDLSWELDRFIQRLRRLVESTQPPRPALRRRLATAIFDGSDATTSLAVAAAGVATEAGFTALGLPGGFGEIVGVAAAKEAQRRLAQTPDDVVIVMLDPIARTKTSAWCLEARLAEARLALDEHILDLAQADLDRLGRSIDRLPDRPDELVAALAAVAEHLDAARALVEAGDADHARGAIDAALAATEQVRASADPRDVAERAEADAREESTRAGEARQREQVARNQDRLKKAAESRPKGAPGV